MRATIVFSTLLFSSALAAPTFKSAPATPELPTEATVEDDILAATAPLGLPVPSFANAPTLPIRDITDSVKTELSPVTNEIAGLIPDTSLATGLASKIPIATRNTIDLSSAISSTSSTLLTSFVSLISTLQSCDHALDSYSASASSHPSNPLAAYSNLAADMSALFTLVEPKIISAVATMQATATTDAGKAASELSADDAKAQAQMWAYAGQAEELLESVVAKMTSLAGVDVGLGLSIKPLVDMAEGWLNQMDSVDEDVQM